jgi:hypothetical protein
MIPCIEWLKPRSMSSGMKYEKSGAMLPITKADMQPHLPSGRAKGRTAAGCAKVKGMEIPESKNRTPGRSLFGTPR